MQYLPTPVQNFVLGLFSPRNQASIPSSIGYQFNGLTSSGNDYQANARAYMANEIVEAAIRLLATSAAEPAIVGRRWRRERPSFASARHAGPVQSMRNQILNKYVEELPQHPLVKLLNNPNPYSTRARLMRFLVMDRYIGGNAYVAKLRGPLGNVVELWRLRPDRVRIIPDGNSGVAAYEYKVGSVTIMFPEEDVIHWDEPHPLDDYYGLSPMSPIMPRVEVDQAMRAMLGSFYTSGGSSPGAILTTSGKLPPEAKEEIRGKLRRLVNGPGSFRETLILEQGTSTYQRLGLERGLTDAVPKDVNSVMESRIAMPFGIPGSILGLLIGFESSSYANKRADWQVLWDITMTPLMSDFDDGFTRSLCPEFGGIDEVLFDLSDIRALQEDIDALHKRARDNKTAGIWSVEEARVITGVPEQPQDGDHFAVPTHETLVEAPFPDMAEQPPAIAPPAPQPAVPASETAANGIAALYSVTVEKPRMLEGPRGGRPAMVADPGARALYQKALAVRAKNPTWAWADVAADIGISERQLRRYRNQFN